MATADVEAVYAHVRRQVDAVAQPAGRQAIRLVVSRATPAVLPVDWLTRRLAGAFRPMVAAPLVALVVLAVVRTLAPRSSEHHSMFDQGSSFLPLLGLFAVSMLAHELGHASASVRYGVPAHDIGFGLYLIYPVFYNEVTAAWGLGRRQRVVIDLAACSSSSSVGAMYLLIHLLTGWELFHVAALTVFVLGLFVLLPIFKFDGYWLLTDLLGVTNLSRQVRRVASTPRPNATRAVAPLPWPRWVSLAVLGYGAFSRAVHPRLRSPLGVVVPDLVATYPRSLGSCVTCPPAAHTGVWSPVEPSRADLRPDRCHVCVDEAGYAPRRRRAPGADQANPAALAAS